MRVISGTARGRRLKELEGMETRPTTDRVKEGMFNVLQFDIEGRRVLDLFAGTGQLGIECLSRGAKEAVFVDRRTDAVRLIRENLKVTDLADRAKVVSGDSVAYLKSLQEQFDIILLDPPYAAGLLEDLGPLEGGYCAEDLERRRLLLLARVKPQLVDAVCEELPSLDEELMLRAKSALNGGDYDRCAALLNGAENQDENWHFLRGQAYLGLKDYEKALRCFQVAEECYKEAAYPLLEQCARELEDFKLAYEYACKQKASR